MKTVIAIQDEFIATLVSAAAKWGHRPCTWNSSGIGGHYPRIRRGAWHKAQREFAKLGFDAQATEKMIGDAQDMAHLEMHAE